MVLVAAGAGWLAGGAAYRSVLRAGGGIWPAHGLVSIVPNPARPACAGGRFPGARCRGRVGDLVLSGQSFAPDRTELNLPALGDFSDGGPFLCAAGFADGRARCVLAK